MWLLIFHHYDAQKLIHAQIMDQKRNSIGYSGHRHLELISGGYFLSFLLCATDFNFRKKFYANI